MKIALDYDGTFTEDKSFWYNFIQTAQDFGHEIYIVTYRHPDLDSIVDSNDLNGFGVAIIYTDGAPKKSFCQNLGLDFSLDRDWETI